MDLISEFANTRSVACHPPILEWQGEERTRTSFQGWLKGYVEWLRDESVLANHAKHGPVEGAVVMQRTFPDALPDGESLIWGTIDPRNVSSMGTARGVGREIVCGVRFLPFS